MSSGGSEFEQTTVFRRFLNQKGGLANVLMAGLCVSPRLSRAIDRAFGRIFPARSRVRAAPTPSRNHPQTPLPSSSDHPPARNPHPPHKTRSCCALSLRLLQMRTEYEQRASALESAFSAERETLRAEIDRLKGKGRWFFGSSRGGGRQSESPRKPDGAKNPPRGLEARANAGKETKGVFI